MACIICGKSNDIKNSRENCDNLSSFERSIFSSWKKECVAATCQILFDNKSEHFVDYFHNAEYCSCCEQVVRDLGFTWKQIQSFQNQIFQLSRKIYNGLNQNYHKIKEKSAADVVTSRISSLLCQQNESDDFSNYSFEEMVEIIYAVISSNQSSGPQPYSFEFESHSFISSNCAKVKTEFTTTKDSDEAMRAEPLQNNNLILKIEGEIDTGYSLQETLPEQDFIPTTKEENIVIDYPENSYNTEVTTKHEINTDCSHENWNDKTVRPSTNISDLTQEVKCPYENCNLCFDTEQKMQVHFYSAHDFDKDKPFRCPCCPMKFKREHTLRSHMLIAHDKSLLCNRCTYCGNLFENLSDLTLHYAESHQIRAPFQCTCCTAFFKTLEYLNNHIDKSHPFEYLHESQLILDVSTSDQELFQTRRTRLNEINIVDNDSQISLSYNRQTVIPNTTTERVTEHSIQNISASEAMESESKTVKCAFGKCTLSFETERNMQTHFYTTHGFDKPYSCPGCPLRFIHEHNLKSHMAKDHDKSLSYNRCSFCGRLFEKKDQLTLHYSNSHKEPTPFKCAFCQGFFKNKEYLINHTNISHPNSYNDDTESSTSSETIESDNSVKSTKKVNSKAKSSIRKFKCNVCGGYLASKSSLRKHRDSHLRIKCKLCSSSFRDRKSLRKHSKAVHSTRYVCGLCDKSFNSRSLMNDHEKTHAAEETAKKKCKFCDKRFLTSQGLEQHEKNHSVIKDCILEERGVGFSNELNPSENSKTRTRKQDLSSVAILPD